jgi:predicted RecB family nuclease
MRNISDQLVLSATDLSNFLNCRHRTALELGEARGKRSRPQFHDPILEALFARGLEHERQYVDALECDGRRIVNLAEITDRAQAIASTTDAMRKGADAIVQAALDDGNWYGRPDVLLKTTGPSDFGAWAYDVADTKLARETRGGTILQLGLYCDMLARIQGCQPERFFVVTPDSTAPVHEFRVDDYAAYFRLIRGRLEETVGEEDEVLASANYPEPVDHCDVCPWSSVCNNKRRADDHLSLVAGISRLQRRELETRDIPTLAALAKMPLPLAFKPKRGAAATFERVREQARVQLAARETQQPVFELIQPIEPEEGLCRLPEPSPRDLFLDLEGDPFAGESGREYLFGIVNVGEGGEPVYRKFWAQSEQEERAAFEAIMSLIMETWDSDPGMHVYHYAPYEPSAFKRLSCRYAVGEQNVDRLLRAGRFVDLYHVVRQSLRAGVERYSIKNMEQFYGFSRSVELLDASRSLRIFEQALELRRFDIATPEVRAAVEGYNADDCLSTLRLRDWLETQRAGLIGNGVDIPRPPPKEAEVSEKLNEREQRVAALREQLLADVPAEASERTPKQWSRWRLAYLLDWHRREAKAGWWEYYRLVEMSEEDLFDEPNAVAGLEFVERVEVVLNKKTGKPTGSVVDRYRYPPQEMEIRGRDEVKLTDGAKFGDVVQADRDARTLDVRKGKKHADTHPTALFAHTHVSTEVLEDAIYRIGEDVASGADATIVQRLLRADPPILRTVPFAARDTESAVDFAVRTANELDNTVLAIQGPPGAGKTFTGARMICALVEQGKRVGVTATSHKVIRNLLDRVAKMSEASGIATKLAQKVGEREDERNTGGAVTEVEDNGEALRLLHDGTANVLGGTVWLWARQDFAQAVDVLFVDEAGQMSLANVLAVAHAAGSIVLLGDPQQLEQPKKGSHPDGINVSALQHILGEHQTIPADRGIFLPVTWRLAPSICEFTSEVFYEDRLTSKPGLDQQQLIAGPFAGSCLWVLDVDHDGNRNASDEEVEAVADLVTTLTASGARWIDEYGVAKQMTGNEILVVAPYNAQVSRLSDRLKNTGVSVGTVDKFQGQQAPVVIYSMATSRPEDAPRGLEFLYSLNRLNVATSRAQCAVILVASPHLFVPDCSTPRQMKLANALCRYREMATITRTRHG